DLARAQRRAARTIRKGQSRSLRRTAARPGRRFRAGLQPRRRSPTSRTTVSYIFLLQLAERFYVVISSSPSFEGGFPGILPSPETGEGNVFGVCMDPTVVTKTSPRLTARATVSASCRSSLDRR